MPKSDPVLVPPIEYWDARLVPKLPCSLSTGGHVMWGYRNWYHTWLASWVPVQALGPEAASLIWLSLQGTP